MNIFLTMDARFLAIISEIQVKDQPGFLKVSLPLIEEVQAKDDKHFHDEETGVELETKEKILLVEWIAEKYKNFGCVLEFVTNKSQEGSQFCRGFGGIGGLLRYAIDLTEFEQPASFDDFYDDDDDDWA